MRPLVSIIIPFYNRASLIQDTILSIKNQTYTNWECILVDDHSTDTTFETVAQFVETDSRFKLFERPAHLKKGPNSCRNYGFTKSCGSIINWFDSDDLYKETALEQVCSSFGKDTDGVVVKVERFNTNTDKTIDYNVITSPNLILDYLVGNVTFYVCGPFWSRSFIEQQPLLFDETITNLDDWDFNLRMLYQNPKLKFMDKALIRYRKFHASLSKALVSHNHTEIMSAFRAREKHVKLLKKEDSNKTLKKFNTFIVNQYKKHLKALLYENSRFSKNVLKQLLRKQISIFYFWDALKTLVISICYMMFNRGNFLLKKL